MQRLQRLMPLAAIRRWMLFFPIEVVTLWNFHLLWLLERWQVRAGKHVRGWLAALGEIEALIAPGNAALTTIPAGLSLSFTRTHIRLCTPSDWRHLAHPLLPPAQAVGNDVVVGPPGSFLLVTGSNMSGKSTLLRAIGVNCVLAQMGRRTICGARLRLPPVTVASVSAYRIRYRRAFPFLWPNPRTQARGLTDLAQRTAATPVLYLLDEILQGTNPAERQIAARHIIRRLVDAGTIGAVSTHDLTLAASA